MQLTLQATFYLNGRTCAAVIIIYYSIFKFKRNFYEVQKGLNFKFYVTKNISKIINFAYTQ